MVIKKFLLYFYKLFCFLGGIKYENLLFDGTLCYRPQIFNNGLVYLFKLNLVRQNKTNIVTVLAGGKIKYIC